MIQVGLSRRARGALATLVGGALVFLLAACGGGGAASQGSSATQSAATQAAATQAAATQAAATPAAATQAAGGGGGGPVSDPCQLITKDEASAVLGDPVTGSAMGPVGGTIDLWVAPLTGCGFHASGTEVLVVGIVPNGAAQFATVKGKTPNATAIPGTGDDAFASDQGGKGTGPFLVGALKGGTAIYLFAIGFKPANGGAVFGAMQALVKVAIGRI